MQNSSLQILFLGDIVSKLGRQGVKRFLQDHRDSYDLVIANCENTSGGKGISKNHAIDLKDAGIDIFTSGNHIWRKKDIIPYMEEYPILRPLNYPPGTPGYGSKIISLEDGTSIGVINIMGRIFMGNPTDCPFRAIENEIQRIKETTPLIFVDFHAETTSEKKAMGYFLDGKATCVVGTHTHIQTHDAQILPQGTGYITDAGMCGAFHSVLGVKSDIIISTYLTQRPALFEIESKGPTIVSYVHIDIDIETAKTTYIRGDYALYED
jgi:hypothetical protein